MKPINYFLLFIFPVICLTACVSGQSVQRQMQGIKSELFYELTTPVYLDNIDNTIFLAPIEESPIIPYTIVKRKGTIVLPFLLYNLVQNKYEITLGDGSLIQLYHEFLMDALLAECNRSSCFDLRVKDSASLPDSALILEIKVNKNVTTAKIVSKDVAFIHPLDILLGEGYFLSSSTLTWNVNQPVSRLEIYARLMQGEKCLWEKTTTAVRDFPYKRKEIENPIRAYETCVDHMTECLSYTTKDIVEIISQNLHLLLLPK